MGRSRSAVSFRLAMLGLLLTCTLPLRAVPAAPDAVEVAQPDGTPVRLRLRGDEFFSWQETDEGYVVLRDRDGYWKYTRPVPGKAEFRAIPGARVAAVNPATVAASPRELPDPDALRIHLGKRRGEFYGRLSPTPEPPAQDLRSETTSPSAAGSLEEPAAPDAPDAEPPQPVPVSGVTSVKNIVILACFSNHWDAVGGTVLPAYGRLDPAEYHALFNELGYAADGALGSVRDYYAEVSYGKFTLDTVVTVWVRLPRDEAYYGNNVDGSGAALVADAIAAAEAAGFDFAQADTDGDGWVDALSVLHSGYGEEAGGGLNPDAVWSHAGALGSVATVDGVRMRRYQTSPALRGNSGTGIVRIGVIGHELGHFFGLPDLYDYSGTTRGVGNWCMMAGGSWNGSSGTSPAHFSAWCKVFLGFAQDREVHSAQGLSLAAVASFPDIVALRDGLPDGEYYLVENRARVGFDNTSSIHPGILIYHIDGGNYNNDRNTWPHPVVKIEEADGNDSLGATLGAGSQAGDAWTASTAFAGGFRDQTGNSTMNAMRYQSAHYYERTNHVASFSHIALDGFSAAGSVMTFDARTLRTTVAAAAALPARGYTVAWPSASSAARYELQEGLPATLTSFADGAEDAESSTLDWQKGGSVRRDNGGARTGSYAYVMYGYYGGKTQTSIQSLTQRTAFTLTANAVVSYHVMARLAADCGYLKCQITNDDGDTWHTLATEAGYIGSWTSRSFNAAALMAAGVQVGDTCRLRFVGSFERIAGWNSWPNYGFAVDDIAITGVEIDGYDAWTTLDDAVTVPQFAVGSRPAGAHAYRVRAFAAEAWQPFGPVGQVVVAANQPPSFAQSEIEGPPATVGEPFAGSLADFASGPEINDPLTFSKLSGPAWLSIAPDGSLSGVPLPADMGVHAFAVRVTDSEGAWDEATVQIRVGPPESGLRTGLVAYLPFDADDLDWSGRGNHPTIHGVASRVAGGLGGHAHVLNGSGYLSFGMLDDLHFQDTVAGNATSFSVSFWAQIPSGSYSGAPPFVANKNWATDDNAGWALASGPGSGGNGVFQMNFKEPNANARNYDWNTAPGTAWHHFLAVLKRDAPRTVTVYVDGAQTHNNTLFASGVNLESAGLPVNLGQDGTGSGTRGTWNGALMDDFGFWRRALTSVEASSIHAAGTNGYALAYAQAGPIVTAISDDLAVPYGGQTQLSVATFSATTVSRQWRLEGESIDQATGTVLDVAHPGQAGVRRYDVVVSNAYGETTSRTVTVTFQPFAPPASPATVLVVR